MKQLTRILAGLALLLLPQKEALAVSSAGSSSGSVLIGLFVGFCVLLIVLQMLPTLMLLVGAVKSLKVKNSDQKLGQGV